MRKMPVLILALALLGLFPSVAASESVGEWHIGGELYQAKGKLRLYINGEPVLSDWVRFPLNPADRGPIRIQYPAELRGQYRGHRILVTCSPMPITADLACTVDIDGERMTVLTFFGDQAGDAKAFPPKGG